MIRGEIMIKRTVFVFDYDTEYQAYSALCDVLKMLKVHYHSYQDTIDDGSDSVCFCVEVGDDIVS